LLPKGVTEHYDAISATLLFRSKGASEEGFTPRSGQKFAKTRAERILSGAPPVRNRKV
jgi:hypothetical protein